MQTFRKSAKIYYMPLWTVSDAVFAKSRKPQDVREIYEQWGGCVCWVLEKPKEESEELLEDSLNAIPADKLWAACQVYNDDEVNSFSCSFRLQHPSFYVLLWAF